MKKIALNVKDDVYSSLERDFNSFVRVSLKCDSQFIAPSFDNFLLAKLSDNTTFLTDDAVKNLMLSGQYAWAKRALDKEFPDVVAILIGQASTYGFHLTINHEWTAEELKISSKAWATSIVKQAQGDEEQIDILAAQIRSSAITVTEVEEKLKTPAYRVAKALRQQLRDARIAVNHASGRAARENLGALRSLLSLGVAYGLLNEKEEQKLMDELKQKKPHLFEEEKTCWDRFMMWWRSVFG
ncbi:hypothetical protein FHW67_000040 [Herbaspirillum sp. Sphag1AN]|uniref:DUF4088 family protein n=1 Tax=unclassified Herbaspirillum TaxID=2624150 RepID=UPI001612AB18|nr:MULTISPECIES: DUF4088 family protein [unclassified Herbaspirillum]MBB3210805.1 hypothetical protein [Herbaspirillum sp. Sphag1AN]MBB3244435.1 hypothetical protein [Herbaspirillum sp. Sphag64]